MVSGLIDWGLIVGRTLLPQDFINKTLSCRLRDQTADTLAIRQIESHHLREWRRIQYLPTDSEVKEVCQREPSLPAIDSRKKKLPHTPSQLTFSGATRTLMSPSFLASSATKCNSPISRTR